MGERFAAPAHCAFSPPRMPTQIPQRADKKSLISTACKTSRPPTSSVSGQMRIEFLVLPKPVLVQNGQEGI